MTGHRAMRGRRRLLILAFDGMDAALVRSWAQAGQLPTFRRLLASGAFAHYVDPPEHSSGTIWPSINTGFPPLEHDLFFAARMRPGSYRTKRGWADDIRKEPFWKWLADQRVGLALFDIPFSIPRAAYGGRQLYGWNQHDWLWKRSSVPPGLFRQLESVAGKRVAPDCHDYTSEPAAVVELRARLIEAIRTRSGAMEALIGTGDWELFYGVYSEAHCAGHLMWHLADERHARHAEADSARLGNALLDVYREIDRSVAILLDRAGDVTTLLLLSHGMGPNYHANHLFPVVMDRLNRLWSGRPLGSDSGRPAPGGVDRVWRRTIGSLPADWRRGVKRVVPHSVRSWIGVKRSANPRHWARLPGFLFPQDGFCSVRVNLVGREPAGKIRPGAEYRRYLDCLEGHLRQLVDAETGVPVVSRIFRADARVDPLRIGGGTDLVVWWANSRPIRAIRSAELGVVEGEALDVRTGEHVMHGLMLLAGGQVRPGPRTIPGMTALDVAPTVCELAGISPPEALPGTSRSAALLAP
jgi:predicted AlkP superfamily phosphohydrolase/phosphomutase